MSKAELKSRFLAVLLALAIAVGVVVGSAALFTLLTGRPFEFAADVLTFQLAIAAAPFLALAIIGVRNRRPWLVGLWLTLALWGYFLFEGVRYQWNPDGSGANIGLGLIMLFSPLVITPISIETHLRQQRRAGDRR